MSVQQRCVYWIVFSIERDLIMNNITQICTDWILDNLSLEEIEADKFILQTPFLDRHNDCIEIYIEKKEDGYLISDSGDNFSENIRPTILNGLGITVVKNELTKYSSAKKLPSNICMLLNAIIMINGILEQKRL